MEIPYELPAKLSVAEVEEWFKTHGEAIPHEDIRAIGFLLKVIKGETIKNPIGDANPKDGELITEHDGAKYLRTIYSPPGTNGGVARVDVYEVIYAFNVRCPARQQAIKKLLTAGERGKGDTMKDLIGARECIHRAIELQQRRDLNKKEE